MKIFTLTAAVILICAGCFHSEDPAPLSATPADGVVGSKSVKVTCGTSSESGQTCCFSNTAYDWASLCGELVVVASPSEKEIGRVTVCSGVMNKRTSVTVNTGIHFEECWQCEPGNNNCCAYKFLVTED
jgi:hypothetical protein